MRDTDFSQLLFVYLETAAEEVELCEQYENLELYEEQRNVIKKWIATIHAQNAAYTSVMFRMAMQCCFSLLIQPADVK